MRGRPVTNHELAALIEAAGRSHAALARKVNAAAANLGLDLRYDQASVYWWLRGRVPDDPVPALLAGILRDWLGRPVEPAGLGFTDPGGHLGLTLAATPDQAAKLASELWRHVVQRRVFLGSGFVVAATTTAGFDWHFSPAPGSAAIARHDGTRAVGMADVERIRQASAEFETLDRIHGGGHAFTWLADYLDREVAPMLTGHYSAATGRELFTAAASATGLAGWMAFDQAKATAWPSGSSSRPSAWPASPVIAFTAHASSPTSPPRRCSSGTARKPPAWPAPPGLVPGGQRQRR